MGQQPAEPFERISVTQAKDLVERDGVPIVDVRNPDEYASGHVPGAVLIPVDSLLNRMDELPENERLIFICGVGQRSALACEMAAAMGLHEGTKIYNVEGGTQDWIQQGYPVDK